MILLADTAHDLFGLSEDFFRVTESPCRDHIGPVYARPNGQRCVIGNVIFCETPFESFWLQSYKGAADGLLYGLGIHPNTRLAQAAVALQILHDSKENWGPSGFVAWEDFFKLKREYA